MFELISCGGDILIVQVQGHRMADEVLCTGFKAELLVHSLHAVLVQIDTLDELSNTYQNGPFGWKTYPGG